MKKIKIYVAYHKKGQIIKNEVFEPIHVGHSLNPDEWFENNMICDNNGINISHKNKGYCELTAHYNVWKNLEQFDNPDYVGFCHYRRLFNFNTEIEYEENNHSKIDYPFINENLYRAFSLNRETIEKVIENNDVITIKKTNLKKIK